MLSLEPLLGRFALFLSLFFQDGQFGGIRFLLLVNLDLCGNQVLLNALDHMLVLALLHHFEVRCLLDGCHIRKSVVFGHSPNILIFFDECFLVLLSVKTAL